MPPSPHDPSGGWNASAEAWIRFVDKGDANRTHLLDPLMLELCGDVRGRRVLDIGCGEGRFCRMLKAQGAKVTGIEPATRLREEARRRDPTGTYLAHDAAKLPLADASFDLCVSYIALVDIADHVRAIAEMARVLVPGGRVVFSNLQPYVTTNSKGWHKDARGQKLHFPIDLYAVPRPLVGRWHHIEVTQYHRPLADIMSAFLGAGLVLRRFLEPVPSAEAMREYPAFEDHARVPLFVVMEWTKPLS